MFELNQRIKLKNKQTNKWQEYDFKLQIDGNYVTYDAADIKTPNISSHTLVDLCGLNKYTTPGKTVLSMFGLTKRSPIDPYQTYKGGISEVFAKRYLQKKYGSAANIEAFTLSQFEGFNQFPEAKPFSGVLDLFMHQPLQLPVEVKSKEMREYERIAQLGIYPKDQLAQGANQAVLVGTDKYMMLWVFLTPAVSKLLKSINEEGLWIWGDDFEKAVEDLDLSMEDFKFHSKIFDADIRMIMAYRKKALDLYNEFFINRRVEKKLFDREELQLLKAE